MRRRRLAALAAGAATLLAPASAGAMDDAQLVRRLTVDAGRLGAAAGAMVVDLDSGRTLFAHRPDVPRIPASNEKLLTTAVALLRFGPRATLDTSVRAPSATAVTPEGVLAGDLYLVGGGDPALDDADLRRLAADVAGAGITRLRGGVVGDESLFDARRGGPRTAFAFDRDMGGVLGALTWGHGRAGAHGPANLAAERLHELLRARGVTAGRRPRAGVLPDAPGLELATVASPPMSDLAAITNQPSDNFYAEILVKALGARFGNAGTTAAGLAVVRAELTRLGIHPRLADGSGLSRANRATPRQLVRLLTRMAGQKVAASWQASLPRFGLDGTVRRRLRGTAAAQRCRAKTGTINQVSALSGYCAKPAGGLIAFSILSNGVFPLSAKLVEDRMVRAITAYRG